MRFFFLTVSVCFVSILSFHFTPASVAQSTKWVGTWSTAPQLVEPNNNPPSPGLSNNTIRQIVRVSLGGDTMRMRFSNEFSTSPVTMQEVRIAVSPSGRDAIDPGTETLLLFNGAPDVTMAAGGAVMSDPVPFPLEPLTTLAITIYFGSTSPSVTGHPGSRTTSYILTGNAVSNADFSGAVRTDHWYVINTIEVLAPEDAAAVAIIGDSITDGRGSGTNEQNRWPDELANRLQENPDTRQVAVLNEGIGGNCVLRPCLGPSALSRFNRDVLQQNGVRWLIILEGINDIGGSSGAGIGNDLIDAFTEMIHHAHLNGIFVYGATLLPMQGSSYFSPQREAERQIVNDWIRTTDMLDGVIDLDLALRNPADTLRLLPEADDGDGLHASEAGHRMMAEAVDLDLFLGRDPLDYTDESTTLFFEPECATVGANWDVLSDALASDGKYVTVKPGIQSLTEAPTGSENLITVPFSVDSTGAYSVFGRVNNPTFDDDSFWVQMDDAGFELHNGLVTTGWEWVDFGDFELTAGAHTLTVGYREDGARLDKLGLSNAPFAPLGLGTDAVNRCTSTGVENETEVPDGFRLGQNYPNPFHPVTSIDYYLPHRSGVTLEVFDLSGRTVATLVDGVERIGQQTITFDGSDLASGVYFYRLSTTSGFVQRRLMVLVK